MNHTLTRHKFTRTERRFAGVWVAAVVAIFVCSCSPNPKFSKATSNSGSMPQKKVIIARVNFRPMERTITANASFVAREVTTLSVKVPGRLETMNVDIGSVVKKGDLLAQIEREDYRLHVRQAEALLDQARARLGLPPGGDGDQIDMETNSVVQQARAVLDEARQNRDRIEELKAEKISSQSEFDTANADYTVAVGKYQNALEDIRERQALVVQRRVELNLARKQFVDSTIYAPFDGVVQQRRTSVGEFLETGTPLLVIAAVDPLRLRIQIPERISTHITEGQPVRVAIDGSTNVYTSLISRVSPMLSESNRMLTAEADVPTRRELRPGLFALATIVISTNDPALCIPESAVSSFVGLEKAFVIEDGKTVERSITTGRRKNGFVEILSGLAAGDDVVLNAAIIRPGEPVTLESNAKAG